MDSTLEIADSCVGCGRCAEVCIRGHIIIGDDSRAHEAESAYPCFACGHCAAVCPRGAVSLRAFPGKQDRAVGPSVAPEDLAELFRERRSRRWFDRGCTREELDRLIGSLRYSPTAENSQAVQYAVIDDRFWEFMVLLADILRTHIGEHPRLEQFVEYVDGGQEERNNPFTWEGRQLVIVFSRLPIDAAIAAEQLDLMACAMGLGGFHSRWMLQASENDPERFMSFFPGVGSELRANAIYVIGHPRIAFRTTVSRKERDVFWMRGSQVSSDHRILVSAALNRNGICVRATNGSVNCGKSDFCNQNLR